VPPTTTTTLPPTTTTTTIPPTTTPTTEPPTTTTTKEETYAYDNYYPIILSLSDNKGNIIKGSGLNNYKGAYHYFITNATLKIGDEIHLKVEASDPQNRQILYNWNPNEEGRPLWTTNNEIKYTITSETIKTAGGWLRIVAQIKSEKEYLRLPGSECDDMIFIDYTLLP